MSRRILFVAREGGLLDTGPRGDAALDRLLPAAGVFAALQRFCRAGFEVVILGTEPAAGTSDEDAFLLQLLASQGVAVTGLERCDHDGSARCDCRPPGLGLVRSYIADSTVDRSHSFVIGSDERALQLAANMGLTGYMLTSAGGRLDWPTVAHAVLDAPRIATTTRKTKETEIDVRVDLDQASEPRISTGIGFFDHMLEQLGKHGGFALEVKCTGDLEVDEHHTVEDVALAIGDALRRALGSKSGIARYGFVLPMDEASAQVSIDLSGRAYFVFEGEFSRESVGGLPTELVPHFFRSLSDSLGATLHLRVNGANDHHKIEASFKGLARTLRQALRREGDELPSTKGSL